MEDDKKMTEAVASDNETVTTPPVVTSQVDTPNTAPVARASLLTKQSVWYVLAFLVILIMGLTLWFFMERDGRVATNVFSGLTAYLESGQPAARVNGTDIAMVDFESTLKQLTDNAASQGVDTANAAIVADLRTQAVESLVNTELLRQKAVANNIQIDTAQVEARYQQIASSIGGVEALQARMQELSVSEEMLRRDIQNDILIQAHIEDAVDMSGVTVEEEEIQQVYDQAGGATAGLPPLEEVREQVEAQVRFQKEQALVAAYVEGLRNEATIEILI